MIRRSLVLIAVIMLWALPVAAQSSTYTVRGGDTLASIAARFDVSLDSLLVANNLTNPNTIFAGQVLVIPGSGGNFGTGGPLTTPPTTPDVIQPGPGAQLPTQPAAPPASPPPTAAITYTVQPGDSLTRIAAAFGVTVNDLVQVNTIPNQNFVFPGQVLALPASASATGGPATPPTVAPTRTYTVRPGDIISLLAVELGVSEDALIAANDLDNPSEIFPGEVLVIP